ncbi:MAG TPA: alpha/beta fold hydrolase, partial [Tepidisphaeraceae bacterium]|nr:alpha/beta fold hydrolase [Tepidisphaeraceae bacterium]
QSDRCAILLHGYADAKIGSIAWAPLMLELGYHVLAVDLRAHGHSDGRDTTAGYFERHDISQVIDQLRTLRPGKTRQIILLGISMGAAVAAATANVRDDIAAIILDSPYAHFRQAARAHASHAGLPGDIFLRGGWNLAQWQTGAHFEEVDPVKTIPTARCPVMVISATKDLLVSPDEQAALQSAIHSRSDSSEFWTQDADHVLNLPSNPEEYLGRMRQFLMNLPKPSATNS